MKLRIRGDSLRLRLTRGEVQQLRATGRVSATTDFGARTLEYALATAEVDAAQARFEGDCIEVTLPRTTANAWADTEQVGIEAEQGALRLLIEKDFQCLAPRAGEEDSDTFPHPNADSGASC
ncbi:hypothetical protein DB30_00914 [Enhygromyxa salina]|uniref:Uncharacterized protein n=1 Tax=Enhygromyxa salina TaxID=215803 RepID=A0A0C1ZPF2_9BACT|nr:hypothetical protein [Enhygromyxa salina]KIG12893.1 hypothetical protein DB30_00914 [Enhygromyxa salina]